MRLANFISSSIVRGFRTIKTRFGSNIVETGTEANTFGHEGKPAGDFIAVIAQTASNEDSIVLGYLNPKAQDLIGDGESIQFSIDNDSTIKSTIISRNDGIIEINGNNDSMVRFSALETAYNELQSKYNALVDLFNLHVHSGVTTGPGSSGPTASQGSQSNGNISAAKINEIKTS